MRRKNSWAPGVVHRRKADFVDEDQVRAQYLVDHLADGVVRQSRVEGLDERWCAEVAHLVTRAHRRVTERDQQVALAGAGGTDETEVTTSHLPDTSHRR